jgi:pteridine reductase
MRKLKGKIALVTGGAKRLGKACSLAMAAEGAEILLHYNRSKTEAEKTALEIHRLGSACTLIQQNLANPESIAAFTEKILSETDNIDILVNSASIFPPDTFKEITFDSIMQNLQVNALSPFLLGKELAKKTKLTDIINFLDSRITGPEPNHSSYHLSKRMLYTMTKLMAESLAPDIRVNAIAPGPILPPDVMSENTDYFEKLKHLNPLHRTGNPDDISQALLFLLKSSFITGQVLFIDGGMHLKGNRYGI